MKRTDYNQNIWYSDDPDRINGNEYQLSAYSVSETAIGIVAPCSHITRGRFPQAGLVRSQNKKIDFCILQNEKVIEFTHDKRTREMAEAEEP